MRTLAFVMLGISIGSSVTPEALGEIQAWPGSVCLLLLAVGATTAASAFHLTLVMCSVHIHATARINPPGIQILLSPQIIHMPWRDQRS
jgi:uncharacterized membrane protein AbrB (regulator of aidB expression)